MEFVVERASENSYERKPCEEAQPRKYIHRYFETEKENTCWVVEINTIEDLLNFVKKHGDVIVQNNNRFIQYKHNGYLLIYDDYIE